MQVNVRMVVRLVKSYNFQVSGTWQVDDCDSFSTSYQTYKEIV
jgi:hypothetical protein